MAWRRSGVNKYLTQTFAHVGLNVARDARVEYEAANQAIIMTLLFIVIPVQQTDINGTTTLNNQDLSRVVR